MNQPVAITIIVHDVLNDYNNILISVKSGSPYVLCSVYIQYVHYTVYTPIITIRIIIITSVKRRELHKSNITWSTLNGTDYASGPSHLADNPAIDGPEFTATRVIYRAVRARAF